MIQIEIRESEKINGEQSAFISFPYDNNLVSIMRQQSNRFWHKDEKIWEVPANKLGEILNSIEGHQIEITGDCYPEVKKQVSVPTGFKFKTEPFQHQVEGFEYGLKYDRFILADEQGLGKTKQVIDIAVAKKQSEDLKHCLIICGVNGLKWNWQAEIKTHSDEESTILGSRTNKKGKTKVGSGLDKLADLENLPESFFLITNVESLRDKKMSEKLSELCKNGTIEMVAFDEIHKCKNPSSQQSKALLKVLPRIRIAMTGTPLMNSPMDLYVIQKWLGYEKHPFYTFKKHYCVMGGYGGYEVIGYKNLNELQESLDSMMLRRLKKDVLDLPEKLHTTEYVEMYPEQARIYNEVKESIKSEIDKIKVSPNPLAMLIRLRQATGYPGILSSSVDASAKLDRMEEIIEELTSNGEKAIVFSNWTDMTTPIYRRLRQYNPAIITGETKNREEEKNRFMNDPDCKVIVGTIGAMGTGLTLTAGTTVIFLDSPWNRANKEQAEDRAHRIGTTQNVNIITLVCKDTIDERIEEIVYNKGVMSDMLVDGQLKNHQDNGQMIEYLLG